MFGGNVKLTSVILAVLNVFFIVVVFALVVRIRKLQKGIFS